MRCDGFPPEDYGLFSLGSLDDKEAIEIASHLDQKCETCVREIRRNLGFWSAYGEALSPAVGEVVRRDWSPILALPPHQAGKSSLGHLAKAWPQWGAIAATLLVASGLTGWVVSVSNIAGKRSLQTRIAALEQRTAQLSRERDQALQATARAEQAQPPVSAPAATIAGQRSAQENNRLRQNLAASRDELTAAQQSLSNAQIEVVQLQTQLSQQQTQLASLRSEQAALEGRAAAAEGNAAQTVRQVQQLQGHIAQLESERARLANLLQLRERQSQQNLRLVADLAQPGTRFVPLAGTESAQGARGYAIITGDNRITLYQVGLPALAANRTYQIWLIRNRGVPVVSGGLFNPNGARQTEVELNAGNLANNLTGIAVTSEPSGGSRLPTGAKLLIGTVRQA